MQGALGAERIGFAAEMFAGVDDQRMEFVKELVAAGERGFEGDAEFLMRGFGVREMVALEDAAGIGVHHENGVFAGVKEDGVSGFRANAAQGQESFAKSGGGCCEKTMERAAVVFVEEGYEGFESFGFLAEVPGGTKVWGELRRRNFLDSGGGQQLGAAQVGDGAFDVFPGSVLGKDGAHDDFETGTAGPPVLWAMGGEQRVIVGMQVVF
jgi:hypothetical protein